MPDFRNRDEVEKALRRLNTGQAVSILAARAALRVLPNVRIQNAKEVPDSLAGLALIAFTSSASIWLPVTLPEKIGKPYAHARQLKRDIDKTTDCFADFFNAASTSRACACASGVSAAMSYAATAYTSTPPQYGVERHAANAVIDSLDSFRLLSDALFFIDALNSSYEAFEVGRQAHDAFAHDLAAFEQRGISPREAGDMPLWPQSTPKQVAHDWGMLASGLRSRREEWGFWINWYGSRLDGKPSTPPPFELAQLPIPAEMWDGGPLVVNSEIKVRLANGTWNRGPSELDAQMALPEAPSVETSANEAGKGAVRGIEADQREPKQPRAQWNSRRGDDLKLSPPEFIRRHYAAEIADNTFNKALIHREDLPLYTRLNNWLRKNEPPADLRIPTKSKWLSEEFVVHDVPRSTSKLLTRLRRDGDTKTRKLIDLHYALRKRPLRPDRDDSK